MSDNAHITDAVEALAEDNKPGVTDLMAVTAKCLEQARANPEGRATHSVIHGPRQRAVLIGLTAGSGLGEHASPPAASFQVLVGEARLYVGNPENPDQSWDVKAGQIVPIPPDRHAVSAITDTVVLLTVSLG